MIPSQALRPLTSLIPIKMTASLHMPHGFLNLKLKLYFRRVALVSRCRQKSLHTFFTSHASSLHRTPQSHYHFTRFAAACCGLAGLLSTAAAPKLYI